MTDIISIHSFRGGTGKSNTTANLAVALARMGKRVGIVDTDIQSPGIHILFGLDDEQMDRSLNDYLWGDCPIEDAAYDVGKKLGVDGGELAVIGGGVHLVPSSIKVGEITRVLREGYDVGVLNDGFTALGDRLRLEYLLIDTHPGLNEETLLSITISNMLLVVLRPDQQDFQGTAVTVDVARKLEVPKILLVVNKALPDYDFDELRAEIERTYDLPVAGILPLSEDVVRLASNGVFCVEEPDH
ncbi:MAG TPA: MinD/ParA family protein, partial [Solirubrobacterales bacterium]|nr:MinD/ParA family protein [Solirubrobacterales bacterium]